MIQVCCECPAGLGLAHDHVVDMGPWLIEWEDFPVTDKVFPISPQRIKSAVKVDKDDPRYRQGVLTGIPSPDQIILAVDWKAVARAIIEAAV